MVPPRRHRRTRRRNRHGQAGLPQARAELAELRDGKERGHKLRDRLTTRAETAERQIAAVRALARPWLWDDALGCIPAKEDQGFYENQYEHGPSGREIMDALDHAALPATSEGLADALNRAGYHPDADPHVPDLVDIRRVVNDPGAVLPRYRGHGIDRDEWESLGNWQARALMHVFTIHQAAPDAGTGDGSAT